MTDHGPNDPSARPHLLHASLGGQPAVLAAWVDAGAVWLALVGDRYPARLHPAEAHALAQCLTALARRASSDARASEPPASEP